ncbi:MAG: metal ABC transporter ATP-binding protein [Treponema sp.]|jgi:zinc transport system ATP-binding protein|nr:metal ABC transporter ATP-binding protein [Treponema sp.]
MSHSDRSIAVRFDTVSFSYGDVRVLENASFHIHRGEFVAIVGPNGSGKTTVLKLLFGLETPSAGSIELFDVICKLPARKGNLAYVPQHLPSDQMFPITVRGIVRMGMLTSFNRYSPIATKFPAHDKTAIAEAMEQAGIADLAARPYRSLSGGQKRRALVARALASKPDLLVLDEPTANMDAESETRLYENLGSYKGKTTIIIVTHDTEYVTALTDRVLCLGDAGGIVQHRIEASNAARHGGFGQAARVLHGENIPADDCCE